jgi:hypothetical protein
MARFNSPETPAGLPSSARTNHCLLLPFLFAVTLAASSCSKSSSPRKSNSESPPQKEANGGYLTGSLNKDEPQAIYADDPKDCWNRIFYCLFTRTVIIRVTEDFPDAAPFDATTNLMGTSTAVTTRVLERIESGDRAIDPLYPHEQFRPDTGAAQVLEEPRYSRFKQALTEALNEKTNRLPLARALMQSDAWAAYDVLSMDVSDSALPDAPIPLFQKRQAELRPLLARFLKKLALTAGEIQSLPDNYALAASAQGLPDLFGRNSEWLEVSWLTNRWHDGAAGNRRSARVFIKPLVPPKDKQAFLNTFWNEYHGRAEFYARPDYSEHVAAVALVVQSLLLDSSGKAVPSPMTFSVETRMFLRDKGGKLTQGKFAEYELNRRLFLTKPSSGGLAVFTENSPAYVRGRNAFDFGFASTPEDPPNFEPQPAMLISMRSRCISCHGPEGQFIITFSFESPNPPAPPVKLLQASGRVRAEYVADKKMKQEDLKQLLELWR